MFGLMRLVGMQISSLSCRLFADGPTDARSERKAAGRKTTRAGAAEGARRAADLVSRENLAAAFFVFSLCLEFRYLAHFMPPRPGRAVPPPTRMEEEGAKRSQVNRR